MEEKKMNSQQIEGRNAVMEAFRSGKPIDKVYILDGCQDGPIRSIVREAKKHDTILNFVTKERLNQISETGRHQGVIAQAAAYEYAQVEDMLELAKQKGEDPFLILLDKADELYLTAMMKREGGVIYNTFYFEQDNYRILTLYPVLMKNLPDDDAKMKRDFEMKYARTQCQSGSIDLTQFCALTEKDRILFLALAEEINMLHMLDFKSRVYLQNIPNLDKNLCAVIENTERKLPKIDEKEQLSVISLLLNLYRWGKYLFGWNVISRMEEHMKYIRSNGNQKMITTFDNFIYECSHELEQAEERYIRSWEENPSFELWQEILQFYKRNNMLDKADEMFEKLFTEQKEYVESEPEYAYRAYILYILDIPQAPDQVLHLVDLHRLGADIEVALLDGAHDIHHGDVEGVHGIWVQLDLVLLHEAARRGNLGSPLGGG